MITKCPVQRLRQQRRQPSRRTLPLPLASPRRWPGPCRKRSRRLMSRTGCTCWGGGPRRPRSPSCCLHHRQVSKLSAVSRVQARGDLTDTRRARRGIRDSSPGSDGRAPASWDHDGDAELAADAAVAASEPGDACRMVGATLAEGGRAVARVGEVGGDVGEGEVDVRDVRGDGCGGGAGRLEVRWCGAGANGAGGLGFVVSGGRLLSPGYGYAMHGLT
jgi:hypothetical protein